MSPAMKMCADAAHAGPNPLPVAEFYKDPSMRDGRKSQCRACTAVAARRRYQADPDKGRLKTRRWQQANLGKVREAGREAQRRVRESLRMAVFGHYGTVCRCCGVAKRLTIDHVEGNGTQHREELFGSKGQGGWVFYRWLVSNDFPDGYQTLCADCNNSKRAGERCRLDHASSSRNPSPGSSGDTTERNE